jgi:hypothetical protein
MGNASMRAKILEGLLGLVLVAEEPAVVRSAIDVLIVVGQSMHKKKTPKQVQFCRWNIMMDAVFFLSSFYIFYLISLTIFGGCLFVS